MLEIVKGRGEWVGGSYFKKGGCTVQGRFPGGIRLKLEGRNGTQAQTYKKAFREKTY